MSGSVGTMRAGSNKHTGPKDKMTKHDRNSQQQQNVGKNEAQSTKVQPTQEQLRLAHDLMSIRQMDADPITVKELMDMTGKSEDVVVIALHDAENDADTAVMMLLEGGDEQGEWREQSGKKKKKGPTTVQKDGSNHVGEEFDGKHKDRGDREDKRDNERNDLPPRRGKRNGGPPPRLSRGRGRDRGNFGDRDNRDRNNTDDWDNDGDERRDRSGADRGRARGRGGFGGRRSGGGGRGRYNNSNDRENRSYNRVPRFEKNNSQPMDGPEIDTWTNETAETTNNKDTDWDNWNETWVNEEDQWTGTLEETKVFTPSQIKMSDPVVSEPPSSLGQRLDVGSLFSESAKFSKAPDYSKPTGDAYITQFNQAATESIKNTIGIGSAPRPPQSLSSMAMPQPASATNSLGLSSLAPASGGQSSVLSSLAQQVQQQPPQQTNSLASSLSQLQMSGISSSHQEQMAAMGSQATREQPSQSRLPSVAQQSQSIGPQANSLQQRPKAPRSKLPPPSKIPSSAVEMPGHIPQNTQLDLQFGIDFGSESSSSSFGFVGSSGETSVATSAYSSTNGSSSVISNHLPQPVHVSKPTSEGSSSVSNIMSSPSAGSTKLPSNMETQPSRQPAVFHNSVYNSSPPKNESPSLDIEQKMTGQDTIPFPSTQMERKSSPLVSSEHPAQTQNLSSGSMALNKSDASSNNIGTNYSATNGYSSSSFPTHQKGTSISSQSQFTHTVSSQGSSFSNQYPSSQSTYPSSGQGQFSGSGSSSQFPQTGQPPQFNSSQSQYSSQNQFSGSSGSQHPSIGGLANHQYSSGSPNTYSSGGQPQYQSYQANASSFPSHPPSSSNYPSSGQSTGSSNSLYPVSSQSNVSSYTSQSSSYQSTTVGSSYHARDSQTNSTVSTQSSGVSFPPAAQSSTLKSGGSQAGSNFSSQTYNSTPAPLQPSSLANKLGESLSKMTMKDTATLDGHQSSQYDHASSSTTSVSLTSASSTVASLSTGTSTISATSTASSITSTSRIASMPSTSKAPPNLPPGVPLMGQYIMGQSTMPPFYSMQPPLYGYDDVQLLAQQRMPLQAGSYYDMGAFPAPAGSTLPAGRDQQPPIPSVSFSGTTADTSKMPRVDAQSPSSAAQPQNAHSTAQQPSLINFHYGYYYPSPSMFPGAAGLQYPTMFPIPPVTNAAAHAGTTATTQFQKNFPSHVYTTKGYDELNQAQDFSKTGYGSTPSSGKTSGTRTGTSDMTANAYSKSHNQAFDKAGFHGGTPPPFNLPMATASQTGPMGAPNTPYGAPFLPMVAAHQAHNQIMHHQIQQDSNSSASRGMSQASNQSKSGASKSYSAGPPYWNN